jgi:hypothetical protein
VVLELREGIRELGNLQPPDWYFLSSPVDMSRLREHDGSLAGTNFTAIVPGQHQFFIPDSWRAPKGALFTAREN